MSLRGISGYNKYKRIYDLESGWETKKEAILQRAHFSYPFVYWGTPYKQILNKTATYFIAGIGKLLKTRYCKDENSHDSSGF